MFGEEKRFYSENYSVAILEGYDVHSKDDLSTGNTIADLYYTSEGYTIPIIYVYRINSEEDIGMDEKGDNMFKDNYISTAGYFPQLARPHISILETEKNNEFTIYYLKKTENSINGNGNYNYYYMYGVGKKGGKIYCILSEDGGVENRDDEDNESILKLHKKQFNEIFNSIQDETNL